MYFNKNLKLFIKELRIHRDINKFKNSVIKEYDSTFQIKNNTYFIHHFNKYIEECIRTNAVNGDKIENDILTIFNEDWRLLSLDILNNFIPNDDII
jgi:hypothetical protein